MRANFVIMGATKCATTSLWGLLKQHPQVFMSDPKEPQFFSRDENFSLGVQWYEEFFAAAGSAIAVGEASANYSNSVFAEAASRRMHDIIPGARLIYCVR